MPIEVKVIKSWHRYRTASARIINHILHIRVPARLSIEEIQKIVNKFKMSIIKKQSKKNSDSQLETLAQKLNQKYFNGSLVYKTITWSTRQNLIFGSCSIRQRTIRISSQLTNTPKWVLEATVMHELTHLVVPGHTKKFWQIANQYPRMERARGYLLGLTTNKHELL